VSTVIASSMAITGTIHVYVVPCEPLDRDHADELHAVIDRFLAALRLGMFPGTLRLVHDTMRGDDGKAHTRFDVMELDLGALRVLHGMLNWFAMMVAPLGTLMAWCEPVGSTPNLFDFDVPLPTHRGPLPFATTSMFSSTSTSATPSLRAEVRFARVLTIDEQHRFTQELHLWAALVHGGYPELGELPGSSTIAPISVRFDQSHTLRLHTDAILAGDACLEPLRALVARWSAIIPVVHLQSE
jgi:hypothetical protein